MNYVYSYSYTKFNFGIINAIAIYTKDHDIMHMESIKCPALQKRHMASRDTACAVSSV